jgi:methylthioribose-1-phosphate isomerase
LPGEQSRFRGKASIAVRTLFGEGEEIKNLLTFGIPGKNCAGFFEEHYPSREWSLLCAESRPHESELGTRLEAFTVRGYETVIITDNMVGFCLLKKRVEGVFLYYQRMVDDGALCQGGSLLMAVLAQECGISCNLFPTDYDLEMAEVDTDLSFAGDIIATKGVKSYVSSVERVPMSYFAKVW